MAIGWLGKVFGSGAKEIIGGVADVADRFITTSDEKKAFEIEMERVVTERLGAIEKTAQTEIEAKAQIITAEMQSGDTYTKRARPSIVYAGLAFVLLNYVLPNYIPGVGMKVEIPGDFWYVWGGICGTWIIGRTAERRGVKSPVVQAITGNRLLE